jgi:hypothetical protein
MADNLGFKEPVRLATTANITLSGEQSIDGQTTSDDRVLVKNQTAPAENGIYVSSSGIWQRATDFNGYDDFETGTAVLVTAGAVAAGKVYYCTVADVPPDVGTSSITWTQANSAAGLGAGLTALEALATTGIIRQTSADVFSAGTLVTNAELADMAQSTFKGRASGAGTGVPVDLTATQATAILNTFTAALKGLVPAPVTATGKFLKDDGTWATSGGDLLAANNLNDVTVAADAFSNIKQAATDTATGVVELATDVEAKAGSDTARVAPVSAMTAAIKNRTESFIVSASDETTALTTGTAKVTFRMPYAMTVTDVRGSLSTAQTSGSLLTFDVNEGGTTILSTKGTFDNGEKTTTTALTARVISDTALADDAEITVDIDAVGDGTAKGLKIAIIGTRT